MRRNLLASLTGSLTGLVIFLLAFYSYTSANRPVASEAVEVVHRNETAFGELAVRGLTPMAGWMFNYNINSELVTTTTTTGTVTFDSNMASLSTGAGANQSAKLETDRAVRYIPGVGGIARFTAIFTDCTAGSQQLIGIGDANNGLFFGCNGSTFGVMRRDNAADNWTAKASWSEAPYIGIDSTIDITKGNVYQIKYQWLGFGAISWYVEDNEGQLQLVHQYRPANTLTTTTIRNPQFPIMAEVSNTSNTSDIVLKTPSALAGVEMVIPGQPDPFKVVHSTEAITVSATANTTATLLTLKNNTTYAGVTNRTRFGLLQVSAAVDGTKNAIVRGYKNATVAGASYANYNANTSAAQTDTAGSATSGNLLFVINLDKAGSAIVDLTNLGVDLAPGDTVSITSFSTANNEVNVSITWSELF